MLNTSEVNSMADATRLYYDGRLMLTITSTSKFKTMPGIKLDTPEQREEAALIQKQGWVQNASYDPAKFEIVHGKSDPVVFSKMTNDLIRKSRENLGT